MRVRDKHWWVQNCVRIHDRHSSGFDSACEFMIDIQVGADDYSSKKVRAIGLCIHEHVRVKAWVCIQESVRALRVGAH